MDTKACTTCGEEKPATLEFFHKHGTRLHPECKVCKCARAKAKYASQGDDEREARNAARRQKYASLSDAEKARLVADAVAWAKANHEKKRKANKKWAESNPEAYREAIRRWHAENAEMSAERNAEWLKANPDAATAIRRRSERKRMLNPTFKISKSMSAAIRGRLRGAKAGRAWLSLVDYTVDELMNHLERQFADGMTWDNYGEWHIDHKRPVASFSFTSPDDLEFLDCWGLENLQPLWAKENQSKGARYQPPETIAA